MDYGQRGVDLCWGGACTEERLAAFVRRVDAGQESLANNNGARGPRFGRAGLIFDFLDFEAVLSNSPSVSLSVPSNSPSSVALCAVLLNFHLVG